MPLPSSPLSACLWFLDLPVLIGYSHSSWRLSFVVEGGCLATTISTRDAASFQLTSNTTFEYSSPHSALGYQTPATAYWWGQPSQKTIGRRGAKGKSEMLSPTIEPEATISARLESEVGSEGDPLRGSKTYDSENLTDRVAKEWGQVTIFCFFR